MISRAVRHYLLALQFFTRIPVTGRLADWVGYSPAMLRASAAHYPGVGCLIGALTAGVFALSLVALPDVGATAWVAAVLSTVAGVLLTGAFHEDGLADTADGLGGGLTRERALDIMKDSRIGTYGTLALVLALLTKVSLLAMVAEVAPLLAVLGLFGGHVVSRLMPMVVIRTMVHVGDTARSKSKPLADQLSNRGLAAGLVWTALGLVPLALLAPGLHWVAAVAGAALGLGIVARLLHRRLRGFTGDGLGATQQVSELGFLLGLLLALGLLPA
ncbi:MAG: adenosylcobinamide-GDP ribazoletransferase [Propionibacterium sp.]|nr:adenosylcobinamide-GDP ribazoletransferase [Propionibacterium sp.]